MRIKLDFIPSCRSLSWHLFAINLHDPQFYFRRKVRMRETESQILWLLRLFPWTSFQVVWVVEYIAVFHKIGILLPKLFWPTVRKNCSSDWEKFLKFEAEGREFAKNLRSLKVRQFQNEFMKSSFLPKYERKIVRIVTV